MSTINTGWLKDDNGDKFAPKTTSTQVVMNDGSNLESKLVNRDVCLTQAQYDALVDIGDVNPDTTYYITDDNVIKATDVTYGDSNVGIALDKLTNTSSTTITANYVKGSINFVRKNGMCLVSYLNDWNNIPKGDLGVIGTIPEGYRPIIGVLTMCNPYNDIQVTFYPGGDITAYNYGNANSGASAGRFSICYPV